MIDIVSNTLAEWGLEGKALLVLTHTLIALSVLTLSYISDLIARRFVVAGMTYFISKTRFEWDNLLLKTGVFNRLAHLVPAVVIYLSISFIYPNTPLVYNLGRSFSLIWMMILGTLVIDALLSAVFEFTKSSSVAKKYGFRTYIQVIKLGIYLFTGIFVISVLINKSPWAFLSGLGALTAIILLIFRDTILGFVAGIQLSVNQMVQTGDWIEVPSMGIDGEVIDVTLNTVKIQNWDKTISTIPPHTLTTTTFKNWRGMAESDGRRIKRFINIDKHSISFCTEDQLVNFENIALLKPYLDHKKKELQTANKSQQTNTPHLANSRRLTNLGTFRIYIKEYLKHHPKVAQNMTLIVRQLQASEKGLPLEVYCFSSDKNWSNYEDIQSDIFDHIYAIIGEFGLKVYQQKL